MTGVIVLVTVPKLGSLFQELMKGMFRQYYDIDTLWNSSKIDLVSYAKVAFNLSAVSHFCHLLHSLTASSLNLSHDFFLLKTPIYSLLGNLPGTELYLDMETHKEVRITFIFIH